MDEEIAEDKMILLLKKEIGVVFERVSAI